MFKKHTNKRKNRSCATGTTNFAQHQQTTTNLVYVVENYILHVRSSETSRLGKLRTTALRLHSTTNRKLRTTATYYSKQVSFNPEGMVLL